MLARFSHNALLVGYRELRPGEATTKMSVPHLRRRAMLIGRLANLSCMILALYAFVVLGGYQLPTFHKVWYDFIQWAESLVNGLVPTEGMFR